MIALRRVLLAVAVMAGVATAAVPARADLHTGQPGQPGHAPVVMFPAFHFTKLLVTVHDQRADPRCPRSGTFQDWFQDNVRSMFSQVCRDELLTLRYDPDPRLPMARRFSDQPGVSVRLLDYGSVRSAPYYQPLYAALEKAGWVADKDIRVAGYDARLTPDQGGFLSRTVRLIEDTYRANGDRRVLLAGHSNGPLYAQYLLTHTSRAWRAKYIAGFVPIAGNFPGQGEFYPAVFTGLNITDFSYPVTKANAVSSARMYLSAPSTYMSMADPAVFGRSQIVLRDVSTGRAYTPADYRQLFTDAHLPIARQIAGYYIGFVKFRDPAHFPDVNVWAERGSGLSTMVGAQLASLTVGQLASRSTVLYTRDGDGNQEDTTNTAIRVWRAMRGFQFSLTDNLGVKHSSLTSNPKVLARLITHAEHA
jgi:lecithin-cholesterol acyltransferase